MDDSSPLETHPFSVQCRFGHGIHNIIQSLCKVVVEIIITKENTLDFDNGGFRRRRTIEGGFKGT